MAHFLNYTNQAFTNVKQKMKSKTTHKRISPLEFLGLIKKEIAIVEFGIDWCGRCRLMSSLIEQVIKKCNAEIKFLRVDIELCAEIKEVYNVFNKPTYLIYKNGKIIDRIDKLISQSEFQSKINSYING